MSYLRGVAPIEYGCLDPDSNPTYLNPLIIKDFMLVKIAMDSALWD